MKIRMAYNKKESAQYIAHLDMTRLFQRAFRRAEVEFVYSAGFNPHAKISFGAPLPVGMAGEREYVDVEIEELAFEAWGQAFVRLNAQMPPGIELLSWQILPPGASKLMALLDTAVYQVEVLWPGKLAESMAQEEAAVLRQAAQRWLERPEIFWQRRKEGKKNISVDIRPFIRSITIFQAGPLAGTECYGMVALEIVTVLGNSGSVRPLEVLGAFCRDEDIRFDLEEAKVRRAGVYWLDAEGERRAPDG